MLEAAHAHACPPPAGMPPAGSRRARAAATGTPETTFRRREKADALAARLDRLEAALARLVPTMDPPAFRSDADEAPAEKPRVRVKAGTCFYQPPAQEPDEALGIIDFEDTIMGVERTRTTLIGRPISRQVKRVLALSCSHWDPGTELINIRAMTLIGLHAAAWRPDDVVHLGDGPNFDSVSKKPRLGVGQPSKRDDYATNRRCWAALNRPMDDADLEARRHYCLGNHDLRAWNFRGADPEREGSLAKRHMSMLTSAGWTVSDFGEGYWLGGVQYVHRPLNVMGQPAGGKNPEQSIADESSRDTVFGDTHRYGCGRSHKLDARIVTALNAGTSMPEFVVHEYAQVGSGRAMSYGCLEVVDFDGYIQGHRFVTMRELEALYGERADELLGVQS